LAKVDPASSISHTCVTGATAIGPPAPSEPLGAEGETGADSGGAEGCVSDGVALAGAGELAGGVGEFELAAGDGVAAGVTGGGWTGACRPTPAASSGGSSCPSPAAPAKDVLGAGPIAAPTATPIASMTPARAAVTRGESERRTVFGALAGTGAGAGAPAATRPTDTEPCACAAVASDGFGV
jgi:hypothetical protein